MRESRVSWQSRQEGDVEAAPRKNARKPLPKHKPTRSSNVDEQFTFRSEDNVNGKMKPKQFLKDLRGKPSKMTKGHIMSNETSYEYKTITVSRSDASTTKDAFELMGWESVDANEAGSTTVTLNFRREQKQENRGRVISMKQHNRDAFSVAATAARRTLAAMH